MIKTYFKGKHFDGMGNIWDGLCGTEALFQNLEAGLKDAVPLFENEKRKIIGLIEQQNHDISVLHLVKRRNGFCEYYSSSPILNGVDYRLKLKEHFTWSNCAEGEFSATGFAPELCENSIGFHGELYLKDLARFKRNKEQKVSISFIAFDIQELPEHKIDIEKGALYDMRLKEFLKDNPDKTKSDFIKPTLIVDAEHFRMFSASDYACEYTIAAPIVNISKTIMFGKEIYKLKVNLAHQDEEPCYLNVYSGKEDFKSYRPKIGDGIIAFGRCTGHFLR